METLLKPTAPSHVRDLEDGLESIQKARQLHEQLIEEHELAATERARIARNIASLLYATECGRNLPTHLRQSLTRLRADADFRAGLSVTEAMRSPSEVWSHYERLQAAAA